MSAALAASFVWACASCHARRADACTCHVARALSVAAPIITPRVRRPRHCSVCGHRGHDKRTCGRPAVCLNDREHCRECRPGRPACRWRRREVKATCTCSAYHFPHRKQSGACKYGGIPAALLKSTAFLEHFGEVG